MTMAQTVACCAGLAGSGKRYKLHGRRSHGFGLFGSRTVQPTSLGACFPSTSQASPQPSASLSSSASSSASQPDEQRLGVPTNLLPQHVAVIMDGNSRWARQRGLAATAGHQAGVEALRTTIRCCTEWGIPCLTIYAFSAENWRRPDAEVSLLLGLMEQVLQAELRALVQQGVRLRFIGELSLLPRSLQQRIARAELETADCCKLHLCVALSYSGRQDITTAVQDIARLVAQGELSPAQVTPALIASHLSTRQLPEAFQEPDLIIRTSGERRLSNFLLWESAYSELYFSEALWPEFGEEHFAAALRDYARRERRYGGRR